MTCEWTQDSDMIIMEVCQNRSSQDSVPCSIRQMMVEMEAAGLVDVTLNGHNCERKTALAGDSAPDTTCEEPCSLPRLQPLVISGNCAVPCFQNTHNLEIPQVHKFNLTPEP